MSEPSKELIAELRRASKPSPEVRRRHWVDLQARLSEEEDPPLPVAPPVEDDRTGGSVVPIAIGIAVAAAALLGWKLGPWEPERHAVVRDDSQAIDVSPTEPGGGALEQRELAPTSLRHVPERAEPLQEEPQVSAPHPVRRRDDTGGEPTKNPGGEDAGAATSNDLAAELALVQEAKRALAAGQPGEALSLVTEHARRFPAGTLEQERRATTVRAQCALGLRDQAAASARAFAAAFPDSGVARALRADPCPEP